MSKNRYDTANELLRSWGSMSNEDFFEGNGPGTFHEGMVFDSKQGEYVPGPELRAQRERQEKANRCPDCGSSLGIYCNCT